MEAEVAAGFAHRRGIAAEGVVIGLCTGTGSRWPQKAWKESQFVELIEQIKGRWVDIRILLYGGPEEAEKHERIVKATGRKALSTGCDNDIRIFAALLNLSQLIVTGDTLSLHLSLALGKKVVALFGPTSMTEIEMYGRGLKLSSDIDCLTCYDSCDKYPNCMDLITPDEVLQAIMKL